MDVRYCDLALILTSVVVLLVSPGATYTQVKGSQVVLPACTLVRCTLDEPKFFPKTIDVGAPVVRS